MRAGSVTEFNSLFSSSVNSGVLKLSEVLKNISRFISLKSVTFQNEIENKVFNFYIFSLPFIFICLVNV